MREEVPYDRGDVARLVPWRVPAREAYQAKVAREQLRSVLRDVQPELNDILETREEDDPGPEHGDDPGPEHIVVATATTRRDDVRMLSDFVEVVASQEGRDLMVEDDDLRQKCANLVRQTERCRLEATVRVAGGGVGKLSSRGTKSRGGSMHTTLTASVLLAARQSTLERQYTAAKRRRPLVVLDLADASVSVEASLQKYADLEGELWQKPVFVVFTDGHDPAQRKALAALQAKVRALERRGALEKNATLLDAARSVVFLNPCDVVKGVSPETSSVLLQAIFKRSSVCGLRLLQHLSGRSDQGFTLRVHRHGDAASSSPPPPKERTKRRDLDAAILVESTPSPCSRTPLVVPGVPSQ